MDIENREDIEWLNYWIEDADKNKKRIILLGDSVARDLRKTLNTFMEGRYVVDLLAMSYGILDDMTLEEIKHFFEKTSYTYDFVIYMMGAHHGYHIECAKSYVDAQRYEERTSEILKSLVEYNANVIVFSSTFERCIDKVGKNVFNHNEEIKKRNQILNIVSNKLNITFYDLNQELNYELIQYLDWCHFYGECYEYISKLIIERFFSNIPCIESNRVKTLREFNIKLNNYKNKSIYIYGNGARGNYIRTYLQKHKYIFGGFIVSDKYVSDEVLLVNQVEKNALIIVTPIDATIWRTLKEKKFDYISLGTDVYTFLKEDSNRL